MFNVFGTRLDLQMGDLLRTEAEAVVVPANDHLWMGAGPALALKQSGGEEIEIEAVRQGPLAPGSAVGTGAGSLGLRRIYHAVVMGQDLHTQHEALPDALRSALKLAARDHVASLAIAPLESEDLAGPFHDAAQRVVTTLFDALGETTTLSSIVLVTAKSESREAYRAALHQLLGGPHK